LQGWDFKQMADVLKSDSLPAAFVVRTPDGYLHVATVQFENGSFQVSNMTSSGSSNSFTYDQFSSGQLNDGGRAFTLMPSAPLIIPAKWSIDLSSNSFISDGPAP
jgi:hypothetical protein